MRSLERYYPRTPFWLILALVLFMLVLAIKANAQSRRALVVESYHSQLHVREATGKNDGFDVEKYLESTGLGQGYAWCAAFVNWNLETVGYAGPEKLPAWSPSWFPSNRTSWQRGVSEWYLPQSGDVFGIYYKSKQRIAHVGFVDQWVPGKDYLITVEGNTNDAGSREGDGVYRKRRLKRSIYKVSNWIDTWHTYY